MILRFTFVLLVLAMGSPVLAVDNSATLVSEFERTCGVMPPSLKAFNNNALEAGFATSGGLSEPVQSAKSFDALYSWRKGEAENRMSLSLYILGPVGQALADCSLGAANLNADAVAADSPRASRSGRG